MDICKRFIIKVDNEENYSKEYHFKVWYLDNEVYYECYTYRYDEYDEVIEQESESYPTLEAWKKAVKQATAEALNNIQ